MSDRRRRPRRRRPKPARPKSARPKPARQVPVPKAAREMIRELERPRKQKKVPPPEPPTRRVEIDGGEWIARLVGHGVIGHGALTRAGVVAIRFTRVDAEDKTFREALMPAGRFEALYDEELRDLWREARTVTREERKS